MADQCMFVPDGDSFTPTEWAVGPWSKDLLQASAFGGLLARALETNAVPDIVLARLSFDLWRPVTRERPAGRRRDQLGARAHRVGRGSLQRHLGGRESARSDVRQRRPHNRLLAAAACAVDLARRGNVRR